MSATIIAESHSQARWLARSTIAPWPAAGQASARPATATVDGDVGSRALRAPGAPGAVGALGAIGAIGAIGAVSAGAALVATLIAGGAHMVVDTTCGDVA